MAKIFDAPASPLLALGILVSESSQDDWHVGVANRRAARRTWLQSPLPRNFVYQFAIPAEEAAQRKTLRRRLAEPQRHHALEREKRGGDLVLLQVPGARTCSCAALVSAWFAHAMQRWPTAVYFGKTEDDILIALPPLLFELARLPAARPLWWGLMVWTGSMAIDATKPAGCWGGAFEDDPMLTAKGVRQTLAKERGCPTAAQPLSPAPTHEADIRSAPLARLLDQCAYPGQWLQSMRRLRLRRCPNDCAAVQGAWLGRCTSGNVTLAHATWTKVHSNSADNGWRPFAPPANLSVVLDMNLGDKKLKRDLRGAWDTAARLMAPTRTTAFPPLLYSYAPARRMGDADMLRLLNPQVAALHFRTCRWGGCHPSRGDASPIMDSWRQSDPLAPLDQRLVISEALLGGR